MDLSSKKALGGVMKKLISAVIYSGLIAGCGSGSGTVKNGEGTKLLPTQAACPAGTTDHIIAIHGGAGVLANLTEAQQAAHRETLTAALRLGAAELDKGMSALDVVELVVIFLENDPKYNAGKGAVFSAAGENELDASIMDGRDRNAGSVAGVKTIRNPIRAARAVMENSRHVMLQGQGAESFAAEQGLAIVDPSHFHTDHRYEQMQKKLDRQNGEYRPFDGPPPTRFGTVGAVVKDNCGDLAAGTSTGGLTAKKWGRVGDTPIIGAGTYADNRYCAVSSTGTGEYFIRATIARDVCARRQYLGESLVAASNHMIHNVLTDMGGDGGIVAIDEAGNYSFSFNTPGMFRGVARSGTLEVGIYE